VRLQASTKATLEAALADATGTAAKEAERNKEAAENLVAEAKRREENAATMVLEYKEKNAELTMKLAAGGHFYRATFHSSGRVYPCHTLLRAMRSQLVHFELGASC
jgi:hypothetical protein